MCDAEMASESRNSSVKCILARKSVEFQIPPEWQYGRQMVRECSEWCSRKQERGILQNEFLPWWWQASEENDRQSPPHRARTEASFHRRMNIGNTVRIQSLQENGTFSSPEEHRTRTHLIRRNVEYVGPPLYLE